MDWLDLHRVQIGVVYIALNALAIVMDLWLVGTGRKTISLRTWLATKAHPTLIAAGILATVGVCFLVHPFWGLVMFAGILGGHLFVHY